MTTQADVLKKSTAQSDIVNLYSQTLRYHDAQKASTAKSYDGLITEWETTQYSNGTDFTLPGSTADRYTYSYSYDNFGRLTSSERFEGTSSSATNAFTERNLSFDGNGNILSLTRYGNGNSAIRDSLTYSYSGNRIERLYGAYNGQTISHIVQNNPVTGTAYYIYDGNGNMTLDALRNITLTYDINNLVSTISRNDTLLSTYFYLADGTKYKAIDKDNKGRAYIGPFSYALEKIGNTVFSYLEGIDTDSGRIMIVRKQSGNQTTADYTTAFFVKDHLGSTRVMLNAQGDILERNAYYPFGLQMNQGKAYPMLTERLPQLYIGYISPTPARRDIYNGKEIQATAGTDYLDYGFRQYDPTLARWFNIDPKAGKYLSMSPYNYCMGSPLYFVDPEGRTGDVKYYEDGTAVVTAKLYFYGNHASSELSKKIADNIASYWNGANAIITYKGKEYSVKFKIYYETVSEEDAINIAKNNKSARNNFIRIGEQKGKSSFASTPRFTDDGGNSFWFNIEDDLETSTTPSHEFGHGLGLKHDERNFANSTNKPNIMIPRETRYGPKWSFINPDGERVVDPKYRRVTSKNVKDAFYHNWGNFYKIPRISLNKIFNENGGEIKY